MDSQNYKQNIRQQIAYNQYQVLRKIGYIEQIEVLKLSNSQVIVLKNYKDIPCQFENESLAIEGLYKKLGEQTFDKAFPVIYDICKEKKFVFMEKLDKDLLQSFFIFNGENQNNEQHAKYLFTQIFQAIQTLHHNNFIHGDIKPENILIYYENLQIKICDFGSSTFANENGQVGCSRGTLRYSHNKLRTELQKNPNLQYNGFKFDIFALGITLFESLIQQEFKQILLMYLPEKQQQFWAKMNQHFPKTALWSDHLKDLFVNMVCPIEHQRYTIDQVINSVWITPTQEEDGEMEVEYINEQFKRFIEENKQQNINGTDDRGINHDTYLALQEAMSYIEKYVAQEEFSSYLNLENNREAKQISLEAIDQSSFKSELTPQQLLTIIIKEGDRIASNWKKEGFLSDSDYFFNVEFDFPFETLVSMYESENINEEEIDLDSFDEEELTPVTKIHPLKFTMQVWQIQGEQGSQKSCIEFTNINKESYLYYLKHINHIKNIIKSY